MTDQIKLSDKVEAPDREMDLLIHSALGFVEFPNLKPFPLVHPHIKSYTSSMDAALTLLPDGCDWLKCLDERGHTMFAVYGADGSELGRSIYTGDDVLALLTAILRTRGL